MCMHAFVHLCMYACLCVCWGGGGGGRYGEGVCVIFVIGGGWVGALVE